MPTYTFTVTRRQYETVEVEADDETTARDMAVDQALADGIDLGDADYDVESGSF